MTYEKTGQLSPADQINEAPNPEGQEEKEPGGVRINGYQQVLEMLMAADPAFRESLLNRLERQDRELAVSLRGHLREAGII